MRYWLQSFLNYIYIYIYIFFFLEKLEEDMEEIPRLQ